MTTNPTKPQRVRIAEYIADNAKCTAINIASALKISDTTVANELNALRTEGVIDCDRSGKPPALRYFPTVEAADLMDAAEHGAADAIDLPSGIQPGSRKAQIWHALRGGKCLSTRQLSDTLHLKRNTIDPTVLEMFKAGLLDRTKGFNNVWTYHHPSTHAENARPAVANNTGSDGAARSPGTPPAEAGAVPNPAPQARTPAPVAADDTDDDDDSMPPADPVLLASSNRMLSGRMDGVAHALRGSGLPALANVTGCEDLQPHVAALTGAYQMALLRIDELVSMDRSARAGAAGPVPEGCGYMVNRGHGISPTYTATLDAARQQAKIDTRNHGTRTTVFALVPVGAAVPSGAEWVAA